MRQKGMTERDTVDHEVSAKSACTAALHNLPPPVRTRHNEDDDHNNDHNNDPNNNRSCILLVEVELQLL